MAMIPCYVVMMLETRHVSVVKSTLYVIAIVSLLAPNGCGVASMCYCCDFVVISRVCVHCEFVVSSLWCRCVTIVVLFWLHCIVAEIY